MTPTGGMDSRLGDMGSSYLGGPDSHRFDGLSAEEALVAFGECEKEGLCHTVWAFVAPFTGGVCNCDRCGCLAMGFTLGHGVKVMFRAE